MCHKRWALNIVIKRQLLTFIIITNEKVCLYRSGVRHKETSRALNDEKKVHDSVIFLLH